jgi:bis(5'-nucleosidyl)-tetraphosphatase
MIFEESFGTIPLKKVNNKWLVFLVQNRSGNHWGFPKGHANISEPQKEAALRELNEETNLTFVRFLTNKTLVEQYFFKRESLDTLKKVYYFLIEVQGESKITTDEIIDGKWVDIEKAKDIITYEASKQISKEVEKILESL